LSASIDLSIAIATYDRPQTLEHTLRSCLAQANRLGLAIEVVIIDNHPSASARGLVEALRSESPMALRYVTELTRNMSVLRNRGFAESRANLVAMIDDDEVADPAWTDELVGALRRTDADIAVGPRLAVFVDGAPPPYDPTGASFARDLGLADGAVIALTRPCGKPRYGLGTGNSLFRKDRCFGVGQLAMRPEFGDAGGEDAELFTRLYRQGRKIVWAANAIVTESVASHRTSASYRLIRTRREAQHYVAIYLDAARRPRLTWCNLMLKGVAQLTFGAALSMATLEFGSERRIRGRMLIEHGLGKLLRRRPVGYIAEPAQAQT
jgi:succinoglycan biosynthesis protein ExoM